VISFTFEDITRDYFYKKFSKSYLPLEALAKFWELLFGYLPFQALLSSACLHCKQQHGFKSHNYHLSRGGGGDIDVSSADSNGENLETCKDRRKMQ